MAEIWNNSSVLRQASCVLASSKQRQVTLEEVSCSVLFGWSQVRQNRSWKGLHALFVCSLPSLSSNQPITNAQPHPRCSIGHIEGAGAGSTSSSTVSLTTNDMEKSSSAGICNHDWLAIQWRLQSQINAQVRQATSWDMHRSLCSGDLRHCGDRPLRAGGRGDHWNLKWCMTKLGKFSLQVTMVLWTLFLTRLTKKYLFQNRKFAQSCVKSCLCSQASVPRHL